MTRPEGAHKFFDRDARPSTNFIYPNTKKESKFKPKNIRKFKSKKKKRMIQDVNRKEIGPKD